MLSADAKILEIGSGVYIRMREYADLVDELHVVVLCGKKSGVELHGGNLHIYPTNSEKKIGRLSDAYKISAGIIQQRAMSATDSLITSQDPFELGMVCMRLKKRFALKLQLQVHTDFLNPFFAAESIKNRARVMMARYTMRHADGIRVVSERIKKSLIDSDFKIDQEKIFVLPVFVDVEAAHVAEPIDLHSRFPHFKKIILIASRLTREKQIVWACEAMKSLVEQHPELGVIILGDGPERAALEKFPFVRVMGWAANVVPYMKGADLFLNTSLYEGYGRTLIEAAAAGVPIITTDVGIAHEVIEDEKNGTVIAVGDESALLVGIAGYLFGGKYFEKKSIEPISKIKYLQDYLGAWQACFR